MAQDVSFRKMLSGAGAFYNQLSYREKICDDLRSSKPVNLVYRHNTESKVWRVVKTIFSIIIFPIGLCQLLHSLVGKIAVLPASNPRLMGYHADHACWSRRGLDIGNQWKYKRISIEVDGYTIDAMIKGKASTLGNGKWMLYSNGNGEFYEDCLQKRDISEILTKFDGNGIFFNYPGVGSCSGMPSRSAMAKAYKAMLCFLEDKEKGIGAKEIVGIGYSIGGGVQGDVLKDHELQKDVKYVFVKSRTFSDLSTAASTIIGSVVGFAVKLLGWNMGSVESSKKLKAPEIIMQTANVNVAENIAKTPQKIVHDGVIPAEGSLAKTLLNIKECRDNPSKYFMGVPEGHNYGFQSIDHLVRKINEMLAL